MSERQCFVFPTNASGCHGLGPAARAMRHHGAEYGVGTGPSGGSYAIPVKRTPRDRSKFGIGEIAWLVTQFVQYAREHPDTTFTVAGDGWGYAAAELAPLFRGAPENVTLPDGWRDTAVAA